MIHKGLLYIFCCFWMLAGLAYGAEDYREVRVADPYLEFHTGPGKGYPIFHVVERGEQVKILKRKTAWFKIRTDKGLEGWVHRTQLEQTLTPAGEKVHIKEVEETDYAGRKWEMGLTGGDFAGAAVMTLYGGYAFTDNMSGEVSVSQVLGDFSSSWLLSTNLLNQPFPEWRFSPFFTLGVGNIWTEPSATLVKKNNRNNVAMNVGIGLRTYLTRRFIFRADYRNYISFTSDEDNEEIDEWKAGFAFFF